MPEQIVLKDGQAKICDAFNQRVRQMKQEIINKKQTALSTLQPYFMPEEEFAASAAVGQEALLADRAVRQLADKYPGGLEALKRDAIIYSCQTINSSLQEVLNWYNNKTAPV